MYELNVEQVLSDVARALEEDLGFRLPNPLPLAGERENVGLWPSKAINDLTAQLIPAAQTARARVITREAAVIAGRPWFDACYRTFDPDSVIDSRAGEGDAVASC